MMHRNRTLPPFERLTFRHAATVAITRQHRLPMTAEVVRILSLQCVAGRTEAQSKKLLVPAGAAQRPLYKACHLLHHTSRRIVQNLNLDHPAANQKAHPVVTTHGELAPKIELPTHTIEQLTTNHLSFDHRI